MEILFCAANFWSSPCHVGSHNLAAAFANLGHSVAFISDPVSPLHLLNGTSRELSSRFELWKKQGEWLHDFENGGKIWAYLAAALFTPHNKPFLKTGLVAKNWHKLTLPRLPSMLKRAGFSSFDLVYVDSCTQAYWWRKLKYKKSVFRLADNPAGFSKHTKAAEAALESVARKTDLLMYTAPNLAGLAKRYTLKTHYFPNAANYELFSKPALRPPEYEREKRPIILYVGAIDYWFDWDCLCHSARLLPDRAFMLIGPETKIPEKAGKLDNIYFLGSRPYAELPAYMQHADAGIIPFAVNSFPALVHSINPLKLYEYMAAGLPVVSTRWKMLEILDSPAMLAGNKEEFAQILSLVSGQNADARPLKINQAFAAEFSWRRQAISLLRHLGLSAGTFNGDTQSGCGIITEIQ